MQVISYIRTNVNEVLKGYQVPVDCKCRVSMAGGGGYKIDNRLDRKAEKKKEKKTEVNGEVHTSRCNNQMCTRRGVK